MADDHDTAPGALEDVIPARLAVAEAELRLHGSLDLTEIARLVLDATVPDLAGAATVFGVERPPLGGETGDIAARRLGTRFAGESRLTEESFPPGEAVAFDADSPYARCLRGEPVVFFSRVDTPTLDRMRPGARSLLSPYASFLAAPAIADGRVTGFLACARAGDRAAFSPEDVSVLARLAAGAGTGIANALRLERQRSLADTLQCGLLAADPEVPPGLEVAARCLPAEGQMIGGDWYDIVALPGNRCGLIVGDVMGHGPEAAAVMAQLRAAARALAQLDLPPSELLRHLDRVTASFLRPVLATCVYAVMDPAGHSCTLSAAGHLPPVLALPGGLTRVPDMPGGQSLGLGTGVYGQARIRLRPGAVIALYTDGLVETRTRSFDQGILALRAALAAWPGRLDTVCDTLVAALAEPHEDDVTVLLARVP